MWGALAKYLVENQRHSSKRLQILAPVDSNPFSVGPYNAAQRILAPFSTSVQRADEVYQSAPRWASKNFSELTIA